jgi:hypothetical protein
MSENVTTENLAGIMPGMVLKSPRPVHRDMYDFAMVLSVGRDEPGRKFRFLLASAHQGLVDVDSISFRLRFGSYTLHQPGGSLHGCPLTRLVPMSEGDKHLADDIASAV